jgi:acyl transferase domain-containing protein/thioesterase domain-containing protein/acyl carrier protein
MEQTRQTREVAIIGMACRFPGAAAATFWRNLCEGVESITFFSEDELLAAGEDHALLRSSSYVKAAPILNDVDKFDAAFFEYSPKEATLMDPQHRLFLEVAWEAFEDAGYHPETYDGVVGVFAGSGGVVTSYLLAHAGHPALAGQTASLPHLGNDKDFLSTRVSYKLNLKGPSVTVQTACSTSLVAVHLACQSLLAGECDMVLAGASTVRIPQRRGYLAEKGNIYSLDGHCRPFDAAGQGTIFGSGVAAVLLKRVRDALADGDHIYAVIKATAVNNDGGRKVSYSAPSVVGQARAMVEALTLADVPPETIRYVECHATGTAVGDPLEIQALTAAFGTNVSLRGFCAVGSVKSNIGHPEQTAGLAGLMKAALALRHGRIPPTLHFVTPNPQIDFANSPFYVSSELRDWPQDPHPRRAAVNSLGMGGTNAFAVLEEAPEVPRASDGPDWPVHLFTLSAKSEPALRAYAERFRTFLDGQPELGLADICYTSNVSRSHFACRLAVMTTSTEDLKHKLAAAAGSPSVRVSTRRRSAGGIAFLCTGQGAQYPGMTAGLYDSHPLFRETLDQCDAWLRPHLEKPLLSVIFAPDAPASLLDETAYTQPALFAVEYALARLWLAWNVAPDALLGHSVGEMVAACLAGVMELEDALWLVAERGRLMQSLPKEGVMAAVFAPEEVVERILGAEPGRVAIAAVNSPQNTVISGERAAVQDCLDRLKRQGIVSKPIKVSHAFHSPLMDPILEAFEQAASRIRYNVPRIPLISNLTGRPIDNVPDARYWREHLRRTVRFADGVRVLGEIGCEVFLEIGPGTVLLGLGRQTLPSVRALWLPSLVRDKHDWQTALETLEQFYLEGVAINWQKVHHGQGCRRVPLPTYPFQRKSYWVEGTPRSVTQGQARDASVHPLLGARVAVSPEEVRFEGVLSLERLPYLADHRIHGKVVFPTAAGLEAALAAGRAWFGGNDLGLENVVYHEALALGENETRPVHLILTRLGADTAVFRLVSPASNDGWRTHMTGVVSKAATGDERSRGGSLEEPRARCPREIRPDVYYPAVRQLGLDYGKSFQGIERLWHGDREAVSQVRLPGGLPADGYSLHPAFLDACLHAYPALVPEYANLSRSTSPRDDVHLPIGIERFRIYRTHVGEAWSHVVLRDGTAGEVLVVDVRVYDQAANLVAVLDGLSLRRLGRDAVTSASDRQFSDRFYELRWDEQPRSERGAWPGREPASWLVFADQGGVGSALAELLERRGDRCHLVVPGPGLSRGDDARWTIDPARPDDYHRLLREVSASERRPFAGSVYLWALDVPPLRDMTADELDHAEATGTRGALFLTQALAEAHSTGLWAGRLWFVTRNAQHLGSGGAPTEAAQAPVWGLARTVALEHPSLRGGVIDLPGAPASPRYDADTLVAELLEPDGEDQVAFRNGERFVPRLARLALERVPRHPVTFQSDATYLITGGLGTLGLRIARWLVEQEGVRFLVLTGRSGAQGPAREAVEALEARGAQVRVIEADVSVDAEVRRLMDAIRDLPPLRGVFHCAGVLDDGVLSQTDWQRFTRVTAPKMRGSWLLHRYTRHVDLDFFVLQSSFLSLTGAAGQANYTAANAFLDSLVGHRRALGLPATAINWGPWGEAGMATVAGSRGEAIWRGRGMRYIPPEDGMQMFARLIRHPIDHAGVALTDWSAYLGQFAEPPPLYRELAREVGWRAAERRSEEGEDLRTRLRRAPRDRRRAVLLDVIRQHVMQELGFEEAIDATQPLSELGLDSLMSVNVAQRLERALGIPVPAVKLIQGPSLERLAEDLLADLASGADGATAGSSSLATGRVASPAGDGWLVFPKPNPSARVRLFCFPYSGGGAAPFRAWADALHPAIELVAIEPPGRASRIDEPAITRLDSGLERLAPLLAPYLDKPAAFFGHCLGALTLFEAARWLRRHGRLDLAHLFVSGARPPHRVARDGPFEEHLLATLLKHERFDPLVPGHEQPDEVFAEMIRHFNIGATEEFLTNAELRRLLLPAVRADFAMASRYQFTPEPPWDVPVTCFVGLDDPYVTRDDALAWGEYTRVAFHVHIRTGAHFLVVDDRAFIVETINRELGG